MSASITALLNNTGDAKQHKERLGIEGTHRNKQSCFQKTLYTFTECAETPSPDK